MTKTLIVNMDKNLISDFIKRNNNSNCQYSFTFGIAQTKLVLCHESINLIIVKNNIDGLANKIGIIYPEIKIDVNED